MLKFSDLFAANTICLLKSYRISSISPATAGRISIIQKLDLVEFQRCKLMAFSCLFLLLWSFSFIEVYAQNAIVAENALPGNPASEWQINGSGDLSIQGFATDISYNKGETARFKIKTNASNYTVRIYRIGYYQGHGARFQGMATVSATLPQSQPNCQTQSSTGLVDCGNWAESASWTIPSNAASGVYIAKLTRTNNNGSSHIVFI